LQPYVVKQVLESSAQGLSITTKLQLRLCANDKLIGAHTVLYKWAMATSASIW